MITFAAQIKYGHLKTDSGWTYGGYSASQTVHQKFIVKVFLKPFLFCSFKKLSGARWIPLGGCGTPVFCAGITMWVFLGISIVIFASGS